MENFMKHISQEIEKNTENVTPPTHQKKPPQNSTKKRAITTLCSLTNIRVLSRI